MIESNAIKYIVFTHWKLTLSTWNLVSKIPEVSTLQRSKSLRGKKTEEVRKVMQTDHKRPI